MSFNEFNPDGMLSIVEAFTDYALSGLTSPFSSYINRVYELRSKDGVKLIVKFYRPQRWTRKAIENEHQYLFDCEKAEIPVVPPLVLKDGTTIGEYNGIYFSVFPKRAGRQFEINNWEDWVRLGGITARMHNVGSEKKAESRIVIDPSISTFADCKYLCENVIPPRFREQYRSICMKLIDVFSPYFEDAEKIRIHGDLHSGNILDRMDEGLLIIDFDDMAMGPPVQDIWLLLPERVEKARSEIELFLEGYEQFRTFDRRTLKCIEPLRAMRMIYFLAWCSRQIDDFQFKKNFPEWGSDMFWQREINDLQEQFDHCLETKRLAGGNEF